MSPSASMYQPKEPSKHTTLSKSLPEYVFITAALILLSFPLIAVSGPVPSPVPTTPPVSTSLDPTITIARYPCSASFLSGRFEIHWKVDHKNKTMYYAMVGKTPGWLGFGVGPNTDKTDSDIIQAYVSNGEVKISDRHAPGVTYPPADRLDILEYSGHENDGVTTVEFHRAFFTGDTHDIDLTNNLNGVHVFVALGTPDAFKKHAFGDTAEGYIDFVACEGRTISRGLARQEIHGILMMIGWVGLPPLAIIVTHYFKWAGNTWHKLHIVLLLTASACVYAGFITIFKGKSDSDQGPVDPWKRAHVITGIIGFALFSFQPFLGLYTDIKKDKNRMKVPFWPDKFHRHLGRVSFLFGLTALSTGIHIWNGGKAWAISLAVLCIFWTVVAIYAKRYQSFPKLTNVDKIPTTMVEMRPYEEEEIPSVPKEPEEVKVVDLESAP